MMLDLRLSILTLDGLEFTQRTTMYGTEAQVSDRRTVVEQRNSGLERSISR